MTGPFEKRPPGGDFRPNKFGGGPKEKKDKDGLRTNREIRATSIRVIDETGAMLGVMSVPEALRLAEDRGLDLMEIAPTASPPTCKIGDYGKWKYENKKKANASRKKQIIVQIKEIQVRPRTDQHDLDTKLRHARSFILDGDKVKVNMRFMGREMAYQEQGHALMRKVIETLSDIATPEANPKFEGKQMYVIMAGDAVKIKEFLKANPKFVKSKPTPADEAKDKDAEGEEE